ncbi:amidase domain-containing protein [Ancylobacter sp. 6x-1]|uniref:Amidase domain-containing protein n=1 Tax=Ancylobacter crimeensis TaxID=2579147 RepID=A0ABT0D7Q6_9HYPH|nr:amidase domain-containing protein [Ancylobacter crimeensis]MCK0195991.1 amidase domain-containing protein [Ancylobacter crimeensis]
MVGFYNRMKAVDYARRWALGRNPMYADYSASKGGGGDCTNFMSQCVLAGGWSMVLPRDDLILNWWAEPPARENSRSWSSVEHFLFFLERSGRGQPCELGQVIQGDIILHQGPGGHLMMVTDIEIDGPRRMPLLSYHSTDRRDYALSYAMVGPGGSGFGVEGYQYWKLRDLY